MTFHRLLQEPNKCLFIYYMQHSIQLVVKVMIINLYDDRHDYDHDNDNYHHVDGHDDND